MKSFLFNKTIFNVNYNKKKKFLSFFLAEKSVEEKISLLNIKTFFSMKKKIQDFLISNIRGFICILELVGLGFSVTSKNDILRFNVGFNHSIYYKIPKEVIVRSKRKTIFLFSHSFFILRKVIVDLKNFRKLSVYKLKGIKERDELYIKKNWKKNIL